MAGRDLTADPPDLAALDTAIAQLLRGLADPDTPARVAPRLVQRLLATAVGLYAATVDRDGPLPAFDAGGELPVPTASEVCLAAALMLEAVSVEVFELALWKSWASAAGPGADTAPREDEGGA